MTTYSLIVSDQVYTNSSPASSASPASPAPDKCKSALLRRRKIVYKYFSGAGKVFLDTSQASPVPEKYFYIQYIYLSDTFPAPEKYLYTNFRRRRSAYIHLSGAGKAGEISIYTHLTYAF